MSVDAAIWLTIAAVSVLALVTRAAFLMSPRLVQALPPRADEVLRMIPPAALAALVVPAFFGPDGSTQVAWPEVVAVGGATAVSLLLRNSALTIGTGIALILLFRFGLGWH
jgi:branched-subunit amino acid transport protein